MHVKVKIYTTYFVPPFNLNNDCVTKGDSGGPVQFVGSLEDKYIMVQYGIVSFGVNTCGKLENVPGIYTKVSSYLGWILDNMEP